jgi:hypothetical protein
MERYTNVLKKIAFAAILLLFASIVSYSLVQTFLPHAKPRATAFKDLAGTARTNPEAYRAYQMGLYYFNKSSKDGLKRAAEYFERATQVDPNFIEPYARLVDCWVWDPNFSAAESKEKIKT